MSRYRVSVTLIVDVDSYAEAEALADSIRAPETVLEMHPAN